MLSGLNFPGSHSSSLSKVSASPWNPAEPAPTSAASQKQEDDTSEIQIIEEEEEEVLVDDFDGQCCRTYPYNHSKIQRFREEKNKKDKEKRKKEEEHKKEQEQKESAKHLANVQSVKIPTSNPEKSLNSTKQNETLTTSAGNKRDAASIFHKKYFWCHLNRDNIYYYRSSTFTKIAPRPKKFINHIFTSGKESLLCYQMKYH